MVLCLIPVGCKRTAVTFFFFLFTSLAAFYCLNVEIKQYNFTHDFNEVDSADVTEPTASRNRIFLQMLLFKMTVIQTYNCGSL